MALQTGQSISGAGRKESGRSSDGANDGVSDQPATVADGLLAAGAGQGQPAECCWNRQRAAVPALCSSGRMDPPLSTGPESDRIRPEPPTRGEGNVSSRREGKELGSRTDRSPARKLTSGQGAGAAAAGPRLDVRTAPGYRVSTLRIRSIQRFRVLSIFPWGRLLPVDPAGAANHAWLDRLRLGETGARYTMPLFRLVAGLLVLALGAIVLSFVLNVLTAILIVSAVGVALGIWLRVRQARHRNATRRLEK